MRTIHILLAILIVLSACGKATVEEIAPGVERYRCDNGRLVTDMSNCDEAVEAEPAIDTSLPAEPEKMPVAETGKAVTSEQEANQAFESYVDDNDLGYQLVSTEYIGFVDGKEYYRVTYSHDERGGGKRTVLVNEEGIVEIELPLA